MFSPLQNNITNLQNLLEQVNSLPEAGTDLPELTNPADASKALSGYEFINEDGEKVTGAIPTRTASDLTASGATVTVPSGYYASQETKSITTATQATPSVSIDNAGKITATATQTAGYVSAGTKTGTKQLTTQAAKTVTPTKSSQTAVASGVYTTGAVTVGAIPSQYVDNSTVDAVESDVMNGKKFGANGSVKTGTFSLDTELSTQDSLIAQIQTALEGKASASEPVLQTKTVTPTTSSQSIKPDSGYDGLSNVIVNAIPSTYVEPSATKAATTYTPSTSNQTIAAGTYCSGIQTIKGDANLKAENIKSGVNIFGITGTASGGGSNSGNIDTCELRVIGAGPCNVVYITSDNSDGVCTDVSLSSAVHNNLTAVCGSYVSIIGNTMNATAGNIQINGVELVLQKDWGAIFKITAAVGESASIQIMMV
jgi:hypothetical protein